MYNPYLTYNNGGEVPSKTGTEFDALVKKYQEQGWNKLTADEQSKYRSLYGNLVKPSGENQVDALQIMEPAVSTATKLPYGTGMRQAVGRGIQRGVDNLEYGMNAVGETLSTPFAMAKSAYKNYGLAGFLAPVTIYNAAQNYDEILPSWITGQKQVQTSEALGIKNPYLATGVDVVSGLLEPGVAIAKAPKAAIKIGKALKGVGKAAVTKTPLKNAYKLNPYAKKTPTKLEDSDLFHTGDNLTLENISVEPRVTRQGKRGTYGGLYTYDNLEDIYRFQKGNRTKNVFGINLKEGVEIKDYKGSIERLDKEKLDLLRNEGNQVIRGKSLFGRDEIVVIDKNALKSVFNPNDPQVPHWLKGYQEKRNPHKKYKNGGMIKQYGNGGTPGNPNQTMQQDYVLGPDGKTLGFYDQFGNFVPSNASTTQANPYVAGMNTPLPQSTFAPQQTMNPMAGVMLGAGQQQMNVNAPAPTTQPKQGVQTPANLFDKFGMRNEFSEALMMDPNMQKSLQTSTADDIKSSLEDATETGGGLTDIADTTEDLASGGKKINPKMLNAGIGLGAAAVTAMGQKFSRGYDQRVGMERPSFGKRMTDLQFTQMGANLGPVGAAVGFGVDFVKNLRGFQKDKSQFNKAETKANFYDKMQNMGAEREYDYTGMARHGMEVHGRNGLWANIHAKRERIKNGSGEKMRSPGSKGAPTDQAFRESQAGYGAEMRMGGNPYMGYGGKYQVGGEVPAELEMNEVVFIPKEDGSYEQYMETSHNAPSHEQGGVKTMLPQGAVVFPGEFKRAAEKAYKFGGKTGDWSQFMMVKDKMLKRAKQAYDMGKPYSSGGAMGYGGKYRDGGKVGFSLPKMPTPQNDMYSRLQSMRPLEKANTFNQIGGMMQQQSKFGYDDQGFPTVMLSDDELGETTTYNLTGAEQQELESLLNERDSGKYDSGKVTKVVGKGKNKKYITGESFKNMNPQKAARLKELQEKAQQTAMVKNTRGTTIATGNGSLPIGSVKHTGNRGVVSGQQQILNALIAKAKEQGVTGLPETLVVDDVMGAKTRAAMDYFQSKGMYKTPELLSAANVARYQQNWKNMSDAQKRAALISGAKAIGLDRESLKKGVYTTFNQGPKTSPTTGAKKDAAVSEQSNAAGKNPLKAAPDMPWYLQPRTENDQSKPNLIGNVLSGIAQFGKDVAKGVAGASQLADMAFQPKPKSNLIGSAAKGLQEFGNNLMLGMQGATQLAEMMGQAQAKQQGSMDMGILGKYAQGLGNFAGDVMKGIEGASQAAEMLSKKQKELRMKDQKNRMLDDAGAMLGYNAKYTMLEPEADRIAQEILQGQGMNTDMRGMPTEGGMPLNKDRLNATQRLLLRTLMQKKSKGKKLSAQEQANYNRLKDIARTVYTFE